MSLPIEDAPERGEPEQEQQEQDDLFGKRHPGIVGQIERAAPGQRSRKKIVDDCGNELEVCARTSPEGSERGHRRLRAKAGRNEVHRIIMEAAQMKEPLAVLPKR
jgi:hypothetical protein